MSCRWSHSLPHPDDACLDCECLNITFDDDGEPNGIDESLPVKCVEHGPHGEHGIELRERDRAGDVLVYYSYFCPECQVWLADDNTVIEVAGPPAEECPRGHGKTVIDGWCVDCVY